MRKLSLLPLLAFLTLNLIAQSPQAFKYQAVVRDTGGLLIANQAISIRAAIVADNPNGTIVYQETHAVNSNEFGLINLEIGSGTALIGAFNSIDWSDGPYFTKIEMDETGGTNYLLLSEAEILSVPYALYAGQAPGDNLGDHAAGQNIALNGQWISDDGDSEGLSVAANGQVGINHVYSNVGLAIRDVPGLSLIHI